MLGLALWAGCRDAQQNYLLEPPPSDTAGGVRLTYSSGRDRAPFWNPAGDTVFYSAEGAYPPLPNSGGVLVGVPRTGGRLTMLLADRQAGAARPRFLTGGAFAPDGKSIAYFELIENTDVLPPCTTFCTFTHDLSTSYVRLERGILRISSLVDGADRDTVPVAFEGRAFDPAHSDYGLTGTLNIKAYPFHRLFLRSGAQPFRPSWSPDGKHVVFSDGLRLLIHNTETRATRVLPNTSDGVYPAWSPTGDWIAYSRLLRSDSTITECLCITPRGGIAQEEHRVVFNEPRPGMGALILIKPDGSQQRVLSAGDMPAWTPDGRRIVFRRGDQLWRVGVDGSEAQALAATEHAEEPSVSPDGRSVAFVRRPPDPVFVRDPLPPVNADIWVVPLRVR